MNKNLLIQGIFGFLVSAAIAEIYAIYSPSNVLTSTITVLVGFVIYKISFIILFHIDTKRKYTNNVTSQINFVILKQIIKKMIFAWSIFDIVNNLSRWIILYELLLWGFGPFEAVIISSIAATSLSYLSINIISRRNKIFWLLKRTHENKIIAIQDRIKNKKISIIENIESRIVYDLADKVAKMHDIDITNR